MKKKVLPVLIAMSILTACSNSNKQIEDESATTTNTDERERFSVDNTTTLSFDVTEHHFGKVFQNTDNMFVFKVSNTGNQPLVIESVDASCGCTVPQKPDEPIKPGQTGEIPVIFHPSLSQSGKMSKTITVKANTNPVITRLKITAEVYERM